MKPDTVRTSLDIPRQLHQRLREAAARRGCSARRLVISAIEKALEEPVAKRPQRRLSLDVPIVSSRGRPFDLSEEEIYDLLENP